MIEFLGLRISLAKIIGSAIYIVFVLVIYLISRRVFKSIFKKAQRKKSVTASQIHRLQTIQQMLLSVIKYIALILIILTILANLGVNVTSLLAGLGIMTAVMGLAFQDMIKDVIAGVTIIIEEQFSVGDTVEINGFKGKVVSMSLKTTRVQNSAGEIMIMANHNIDGLINCEKRA